MNPADENPPLADVEVLVFSISHPYEKAFPLLVMCPRCGWFDVGPIIPNHNMVLFVAKAGAISAVSNRTAYVIVLCVSVPCPPRRPRVSSLGMKDSNND